MGIMVYSLFWVMQDLNHHLYELQGTRIRHPNIVLYTYNPEPQGKSFVGIEAKEPYQDAEP